MFTVTKLIIAKIGVADDPDRPGKSLALRKFLPVATFPASGRLPRINQDCA